MEKFFPIPRFSAPTPWISLGLMGVHAGAGQTVGSSAASQCFPLRSPFVPLDLSLCLEAMQSLGTLSTQSGSLLATGSGKLILFVGRANRKRNNCREQLFMSEVCLGQPEPQQISPQSYSASTSPSPIPLGLLLPLILSPLLSHRSTEAQ